MSSPPETPVDLAADLLVGADAVAKFTGLTKRQVYNCVDQGNMPFFKIGKIVCARRSAILRWLIAAEREYAEYVSQKWSTAKGSPD